MKITHLNPDSLHKNPAFSQGISVESPAKWVFVGGQNAVNMDGQIVGEDLATQTEQALKNVLAVLGAAGASQESVVKLSVYFVEGHSVEEAFEAAQRVWGMHPTTISVLFVAGLANPKFLVEIESLTAVEA